MTPKEKLDRLREALGHDDRNLLGDVLNSARYSAYDAGYVDGVTAFAIWKDGVQQVGCLRTPLEQSLAQRKSNYNYFPDLVDLIPASPHD